MRNIYGKSNSFTSISTAFIFLAIFSLSNQSCSNPATKAHPPPKKTGTTYDKSKSDLVKQAKGLVRHYKLSKLPITCLTFEVQDNPVEGKQMIDVRERHKNGCEGDPETSPRLFSIAIDPSGEIWSDATSVLGQLEKLN